MRYMFTALPRSIVQFMYVNDEINSRSNWMQTVHPERVKMVELATTTLDTALVLEITTTSLTALLAALGGMVQIARFVC